MGFDERAGISRLAEVMAGRMKRESSHPVYFELGTIDSGYNLQTDSFPALIPKGDYMICRSLLIGEEESELIRVRQRGTQEILDYYVPVPKQLRKLVPGDRVLVLWMDADAVVVDIVVAAAEQRLGG